MGHKLVNADELETYQEVGTRFGISDRRVAQLVKDAGLPTHSDVLDKRRKLLGPEHVEAIERILRVRPTTSAPQSSRTHDTDPIQTLPSVVADLVQRVESLEASEKRSQDLRAVMDQRFQGLFETIASITQTNAFLLQRLIVLEKQAPEPTRQVGKVAATAN